MILAMDGGGSKTSLLLSDKEGHIQAEYTLDGCNYLQVGFDGLEETITKGIAEVCQQGQILPTQLEFAVLGVPGYGEIAVNSVAIERLIARLLPVSYVILNDGKLAWAGSLACQPGIVVLSGTGSMSFGVDNEGRDWRAGGWGHYFGDEGSAYWLGRKCCQLFSRMSAGRSVRGALYQIMRTKFQLENDFDLIEIVANMTNSRKQIAAMAKLLYQAAKQGDQLAQKVFEEAATELASLASSIAKPFLQGKGQPQSLHISYAGGSFACGDFLLKPLENSLRSMLPDDCVCFSPPVLQPKLGACLYGAIRLGWHAKCYADKLASYQQNN